MRKSNKLKFDQKNPYKLKFVQNYSLYVTFILSNLAVIILNTILFLQLNKLDECIDECTKAIEFDENYIKAYSRRAKSFMEKEEYEQAVSDYEKLFKIDKSKGLAFINLV